MMAINHKEKVWTTPTIVPKPFDVQEETNSVQSLISSEGTKWLFNKTIRNEEEVLSTGNDLSGWSEVIVPGEVAMQGHDIENNTPYYYKSIVMIPTGFTEKHIILRFHGIYSKAKVWVNGQYIRSHKGGFTTWDCNIKDAVVPGQEAVILVQFIDDIWDPSIGSIYAHHNMGGIIRNVELIALPADHFTRLHYLVDFDEEYKNARLSVEMGINAGEFTEKFVQLELYDNDQRPVSLENSTVPFPKGQTEQEIMLYIDNPIKWNAEQPYLYTLKAKLYSDQKEIIQTTQIKVGFRKITYGGANGTDKKEIYVNGDPIKLRGTCRHSVHPTLGRVTTPEMDRNDIIMLKEQNVNYARTSHYPPTKEFLEACDELGMYVEEETAVNFQYANGPGPWGDDEEWYMDQFAEMIERDKSHASVIIWSLANESGWREGVEGDKYRRQYRYLKQVDTSRPAKFSYPFMVEDGTIADIYSAHYAEYREDMSHYKINYGVGSINEDLITEKEPPVVHDEYAHIACYNLNEIERDNNVRNFWGESISLFWEKIVETRGALGGALWANIDDVFHLPEGVKERHQVHSVGPAAGYGEWGNMSDQWRREKPEYWLTKKAYSPIRIEDKPLGSQGFKEVKIPVQNWFNHTNLQDVQVYWQVILGEEIVEQGRQAGPNVKPYQQGYISLPKRKWDDREAVQLQFVTGDGITVDEYKLPLVLTEVTFKGENSSPLQVKETADHWHISNQTLSFLYDKQKGQLEMASYEGKALITGGPHLHVTGTVLGSWNANEMNVVRKNNGESVEVTITGTYSNGTVVEFLQTISCDGQLKTHYQILEEQITAHQQEIGIEYAIDPSVQEVEWERLGFHSVYPQNHIGRSKGIAKRVREGYEKQPDTYREQPMWDWKDDMRNFFLERENDPDKGLVTKDFNSMREHILYYSVKFPETEARIRVESDGQVGARMSYKHTANPIVNDRDTEKLTYTGDWEIGSDAHCYMGTETLSNKPGAKVSYTFYGTGINLIYKKQANTGPILIHIDDSDPELLDTHSDIGTPLYHQKYEVKNLPLGEHTITVQIPEQNSNAYVVIDAFEIINQTIPREIQAKLIINNEWNYEGLGWGNYVGKPVNLKTGYQNEVTMRLTNDNGYQNK